VSFNLKLKYAFPQGGGFFLTRSRDRPLNLHYYHKKEDHKPNRPGHYIKNQDKLIKKYNGKITALKDGVVIGLYQPKADALYDILDCDHKEGSFMIILRTPGDGQYSASFFPGVSFKEVALK
jgi:hypothetical protein